MKTFLICHTGALGDFVLAWPSLLGLRKAFPHHRFVGIGRPEYLRLAIRLGLLDEFHDVDGADMIPFFAGTELPDGIVPPDAAVLWLTDAEPIVRMLARQAEKPVLAIPPFPPVRQHIARYYAETIQQFFPISIPDVFQLSWPDSVPIEDRVLIHPGSGSPKKNYSTQFYLRLADFIGAETNLEVRFVLGPVECERMSYEEFCEYPVDYPENVLALAERMAASRLFIGNDSGPSHLAGVLGVPTVAFYKSTNPKIWGVMGSKVVMIHQSDEETAFADFRDAFEKWKKEV